MFFNHSLNSRKRLSAALLLLSVGLLVLSCGVAWQHAFAPLLHLSAARDDFFHGFSMGLGLTLEIAALVMLVHISVNRPRS
jgi:FtsH-binding integral membrane protein